MPRDARNDRPRTLTRRDLVDALERETGLSPDECRDHLEDVLSTIIDRLGRDERVQITVGRNPKTLEEVAIPPRRVVQFRMSKEARARIARALK